jgi:hypothetical protein
MVTERRRQILLGAVAIVLAVVAYQVWPRTSTLPIAASNQRSAPQGSAAGTTGSKARAEKEPGKQSAANSGAPDVHLEALEAEHPKPSSADRNLFRFKPKAPPPPPPSAATNQPVDVPPAAPPGPPPPPPITVKFIGLAEREVPGKPKIAVLSDGLGAPQTGTEGEVVFGKYRILKIGVESIEMAYLDGRGRQTIRLSGS